MNYWGYMPNDMINGVGVSVSMWVSGCPHACKGCYNDKAWDFNSGVPIPLDIKGRLIKALTANNVNRNFSILGGEPLAWQNRHEIKEIIQSIKSALPHIKIFLWTGYTLDELLMARPLDSDLDYILNNITVLIDGRYIQEERDISLWLRGSRNQNVYKLTKDKEFVIINSEEDIRND